MNNKLDSFNEDKFKCKKCKNYFDKVPIPSSIPPRKYTNELCEKCFEMWIASDDECYGKWFSYYDHLKIYKEFLNEQ